MDIRLELDPAKVMAQKFEARFRQAQKNLDEDVLRSCEPYVPKRTGALANSGHQATRPGSGKVIWRTRYACYQYYGFSYHHAGNPQASAQWFQKAKAVDKEAWIASAQRTITGR